MTTEGPTRASSSAPGPRPRPGILDLAPYVGGESSAASAAPPLRLAQNETALGPSPLAMAAYTRLAATLHRYPDGSSADLRAAVAHRFGLDPARVVCGAGSDELIGLLVRAYAGPGDEVLYSRHGFMMYPIAAQAAGATPVTAPERDLTADVDALLAAVSPRTRIVFLANPNNPTGTYLSAAQLDRLHAGLRPDILLVIDAAYAEYVTRNDYADGSALVERAHNVVMTRTFSKIFGLAALRLGWAYASAGIADVLNRVRGPFNVSLPAQAAGVAALADTAHLSRARTEVEHLRPRVREQLLARGLEVTDSVANFLLVRFPTTPGRTADAVHTALAARGILTRKMGGYGLPDWLRITIGRPDDMDRVVAAIDALLAGSDAAPAPRPVGASARA